MITTLTLSPCLDKTITVGQFYIDRVNRAESSRIDAGGKGVNVALALAALDADVQAIGIGFEDAGDITNALDRAKVAHEFVACSGRLRTNLKIFDRSTGSTIELNEQNPTVSDEIIGKVNLLCRRAAIDSEILVLSGSVPPNAPPDIYRTLAFEARAANPDIKIVLDSSGSLLIDGFKASPFFVKPNVEELENAFGIELKSESDIITFCRHLIYKYNTSMILTSMGSAGAVLVTKNKALKAPAADIQPKSAQGAGDAMVAGACLAICKGLDERQILAYGIAASAGAVELEGTAFCGTERFKELLSGVTVQSV